MLETFDDHGDLLVNPAYRAELQNAGLCSAAAVHAFGTQGELISSGARLYLRKRPLTDFVAYTKTYFYDPPAWRYIGRNNRVDRELFSFDTFRRLGIRHPEVIAYAKKHVGPRLAWAILMTREVEDAPNLLQVFGGDTPAAVRLEILTQLGTYAARLAAGRFRHGSFRFRNVLARLNPAGGVTLFFLDCPRGRNQYWYERDRERDVRDLYRDAKRLCSEDEWGTFMAAFNNPGVLKAA